MKNFKYDTSKYDDYQKIAQGDILFSIGKAIHETEPGLCRELARLEKHGKSSWDMSYKEAFELGEKKVNLYNKYKRLHLKK